MWTRLYVPATVAVLCAMAIATPAGADRPAPPPQPTSGPGGADYAHEAVHVSSYALGNLRYWIFEPEQPRPAKAPVVVFFHGWGAMDPRPYRAWIDHLVRRGNIVVYPRYQSSVLTSPKLFTANALTATKAALQRLESDAHVRPDALRLAATGHSVGGLLAANFAARAAAEGLPQPRAVMSVQPGRSWGPEPLTVPLDDLSAVASDTLLLVVVGDVDEITGDIDSRRIFRETTRVPAANKNYVILQSDRYGQPPLIAHHLAPLARALDSEGNGEMLGGFSVDALDFYGTWKLLDGLCDAAFFGRNREYALGGGAAQRFMGVWSDGTLVRELEVLAAP